VARLDRLIERVTLAADELRDERRLLEDAWPRSAAILRLVA
jgi:hypothetical protein